MFFGNKASQIEKYAKKRNSAKLVTMIKDSDPEVRSLAIKALGTLGDETAVNTLISLLTDPDQATRMTVINSMGGMANQVLKSHLQHMIMTETNEDIKKAIRAAIAKIPNKN